MITIQFVPYSEVSSLSPKDRIRRLVGIVRDNKIVLLEGRLAKEEQAQLISATMESINGRFRGIELSVVFAEQQKGVFGALSSRIVEALAGPKQGLTIIGPATVVKEIKKDPDKIQLLTFDTGKRKRRGG